MAKSRLNDFSQTATDNSDLAGIGIQGTNKPRNLDDAIRALMAILADWREGTSLNATANFNDPTDTSKTFEFSAANIPTATNREIDAEAVYDLSVDTVLPKLMAAGLSAFRNYLSGFRLSNNGTDATNDIDIAAGSCMDSTNSYFIELTSSITKRLDALWVVGTGQGGLDTGSIANTTYHVYVIKRLDTGVVDVTLSTSATAPTLPANYTIFRRIDSIIRAGGTILGFSKLGDKTLLNVPVLDADTNLGTTAATQTLDTIPAGIQVDALIRVRGFNTSSWSIIISSLDVADTAPSISGNPLGDIAGNNSSDRGTIAVRTNTSRQVRARSTASSTDLQISTYGWIDTRGK